MKVSNVKQGKIKATQQQSVAQASTVKTPVAQQTAVTKTDVAHLNKHAQNGHDPRMFKIDDDPRVTSFQLTS